MKARNQTNAFVNSTEAEEAREAVTGTSLSLDGSTWDGQLQGVAADLQSAVNALDDAHKNPPDFVLLIENALI